MSAQSKLSNVLRDTHEDKQHIQIPVPLRQFLFIKLLGNFVICGPDIRVDTTRNIRGFIMGRGGVRAGRGHGIEPIGVIRGGVIAAGSTAW